MCSVNYCDRYIHRVCFVVVAVVVAVAVVVVVVVVVVASTYLPRRR